jgi:peptidoglycan glycosyltransferase
MNKPIRTMAIFCLLLFLALAGNATYLQFVRAGELNDDSRNTRVFIDAFSRERGAILAGRVSVAESTPSDDEYKFQRVYPRPFLYAHVTGWFSYFSQSGIELAENDVLSGEDESLFVDRLIDVALNGEPKGGSVVLTIDPNAQLAALQGLQALGPRTQGAVVALEPATGRILAMVSTPTFDPNRLASHDLSAVSQADQELNAREDEPKLNRAISTTLPPGSTFKLVTAAAALESGNYTADGTVPGGATYRLPQSSTVIGNGGRDCGSDQIPFVQALEQSCNTTFLALADELGNERMMEMAERFGFNSTSLEDLPGERASDYPVMDEPQTAMSGMGQSSVTASPLQMAMVVAAIANNGTLMRPHIVRERRSPDFDSLGDEEVEELSDVMSAQTARDLQSMLVAVVQNGTGANAAIPGVEVAGKTGTAEPGRDDLPNYAWFVSFAPASNAQVAVAVMLQNANVPNDQVAGGRLAGPIAKAVMEAVLNS